MRLASAFVLAAFAVGSRGATPQAAVSNALAAGSPGLAIARVNEAGGYALVNAQNARIEGNPMSSSRFLVQQFPFGWQVVGWLDRRCDLAARGISAASIAVLAAGMNVPAGSQADCADALAGFAPDSGPAADVAAVRAITTGPVIPRAVVHGDYAMATWIGAGGGQEVFARTGGKWQMIAHGGGAYMSADLIDVGVPKSDACALFEAITLSKDCR